MVDKLRFGFDYVYLTIWSWQKHFDEEVPWERDMTAAAYMAFPIILLESLIADHPLGRLFYSNRIVYLLALGLPTVFFFCFVARRLAHQQRSEERLATIRRQTSYRIRVATTVLFFAIPITLVLTSLVVARSGS